MSREGFEVRLARTACIAVAVAFLLGLPAAVPGEDGDAIIGLWNTAEKDARIEIFKCGTEYCGRISYLKDPNYPPDDPNGLAGLPIVDRNNPDPELRNRPLLGLKFIEGFRYMGHNTWGEGESIMLKTERRTERRSVLQTTTI